MTKYRQSKIYSILNNKCPHCHQGNFFVTSNPYDLKRWWHMYPKCPVCNENFRRETGFYFGAVYVSYAMTVAYGVILFLLLGVLFKMEVLTFLIIFSISLIVLLPVFYRFARLIWINFFVKYDKRLDK